MAVNEPINTIAVQTSMTPVEKTAFLSFMADLVNDVDPMTLVPFLYANGNVGREVYETVQQRFQTGASRKSIMEDVIKYLPFVSTFPAVVFCLDKCGYQRLAARLFLRLIQANNKIYHVHKSEVRDRAKLHKLARNLKRMVHDAQFKNPREALREMARRYRYQFDTEADLGKRQLLADKCVAVLGVEIDAHYDSLSCEIEISQEEMLKEMQEIVPFTSNPLVSDTVYYSRYANLDAFHGDFHHGENMLIQARDSGYNVGSCLELVNMLYIEVYVKLWELERNPSKELLDALMVWGRIGLESLEDEDSDTLVMWRRMFILRMVFGLLGIGNRANIIPNYKVDTGNLQLAQLLLASIDTQWSGIETRREMFYCVARARLNEQQGLYPDAKLYICRARSLAEQGQFLEKIPFIDNFKMYLEQKTSNNLASEASFDRVLNQCKSQNLSCNNADDVLYSTRPKAYKREQCFTTMQRTKESQNHHLTSNQQDDVVVANFRQSVQIADTAAKNSHYLNPFDTCVPSESVTDVKQAVERQAHLTSKSEQNIEIQEAREHLIHSEKDIQYEGHQCMHLLDFCDEDESETFVKDEADNQRHQLMSLSFREHNLKSVKQSVEQREDRMTPEQCLEITKPETDDSLTFAKKRLEKETRQDVRLHELVERPGNTATVLPGVGNDISTAVNPIPQKEVINLNMDHSIFPYGRNSVLRKSIPSANTYLATADNSNIRLKTFRSDRSNENISIKANENDDTESGSSSTTCLKQNAMGVNVGNQTPFVQVVKPRSTEISTALPFASRRDVGDIVGAEDGTVTRETASTFSVESFSTTKSTQKACCKESINSLVLFEERETPEGMSSEVNLDKKAYNKTLETGAGIPHKTCNMDNMTELVMEQTLDVIQTQNEQELFIDDDALFGD